MNLTVERAEVWAASIKDTPGALANVLTTLAEAGANVQFVIARRAPENPGTGVVFVTPLQGDREVRAATQAGFNVTQRVQSLRLSGADKPGIGAEITRTLASAGINLRGLSASVIGNQFVAYLALDTADDASKAAEALKG
jgi:hypothetical protein